MVQIMIWQCYVSGYYKLSDQDYYILLIILLCKFQVPHTSCCGAVPGESVRFLYNRNCHMLNDVCSLGSRPSAVEAFFFHFLPAHTMLIFAITVLVVM